MAVIPSKETPGQAFMPTPIKNSALEEKIGGFSTVCEALDYAAQGETGYNFFNLRGEAARVLPYRELREAAKTLARKLAGRFERGDRLAVIAETSPEFLIVFYACQYAGLVPAPMPMPVNLGGKDGYINQIRQMIAGANAAAAIGPETLREFLEQRLGRVVEGVILSHRGEADFNEVEAVLRDFQNAPPEDKRRILDELKKMGGEACITAAQRKELQRALKRQLVKRSSLLKIVSAWISTVPVSAVLASIFYFALRGMMLP